MACPNSSAFAVSSTTAAAQMEHRSKRSGGAPRISGFTREFEKADNGASMELDTTAIGRRGWVNNCAYSLPPKRAASAVFGAIDFSERCRGGVQGFLYECEVGAFIGLTSR